MLPQAKECWEPPEAGTDPKTSRENLASGHLDPRVPALTAVRGEVLSLGLRPLQHNSGSAGPPERGKEGQIVGSLTYDV